MKYQGLYPHIAVFLIMFLMLTLAGTYNSWTERLVVGTVAGLLLVSKLSFSNGNRCVKYDIRGFKTAS